MFLFYILLCFSSGSGLFADLTNQLLDDSVSLETIKELSSEIVKKLYGGKPGDTLGKLRYPKLFKCILFTKYCERYAKFQEMAAKGVVDPNKLPPTSDTVFLHCLRSIYQAKVWMTLDVNTMDPLLWGWRVIDGVFTPIQTNVECAPDTLLKFVRCKCKSGCTSNNCSCKKHGLPCVTACKNCRGDCENIQVKCNNYSSFCFNNYIPV